MDYWTKELGAGADALRAAAAAVGNPADKVTRRKPEEWLAHGPDAEIPL